MTIMEHPDYMQQVIPDGLDHVRHGKTSFRWVNPPKYDQETPEWGSEVKETAGAKINELIERYKWIKVRYENNIALIHRCYDHLPKEDFTLEFYLRFETIPAVEERKILKKNPKPKACGKILNEKYLKNIKIILLMFWRKR